MPTRWRKVLADLWFNKTRTVIMILTITLGLFSVGLVGDLGAMMNRDMDNDYWQARPAQATINASPLDENWVRSLRKFPGVQDVEGRTQVVAQLVKPDGEKIAIQFIAPHSFASMRLNLLQPADPHDSTIPSMDRKDVLFDRTAAGLGYHPGDALYVELANGKTRTLTFKGYVHDVTTIPASMGNILTGYVSMDSIQYLGGPDCYNQLLVTVSTDPTNANHVTEVANAITDRFKKDGTITVGSVLVYNPGHHYAWQITQGVIFILTLLGWLTVLLSTFLIVNTIVSLISQHTRQIGIMKAIGGGNAQIFGMYVALLLAFSLIALAISIPLSHFAAGLIGRYMAAYLNYNQGPQTFDLPTLLTQGLLAFLAPLLAALLPLLNGLRVPVRQALNDYGIGNAVSRRTQKGLHLDFLPRPVLLSLRNAVRRKARLALTLSALVLGGAIFIAVFNLWHSFGQTMQDVQGYFLADINIDFTGPYYFDDLSRIALRQPGVTGVEGWLTADASVVSPDGQAHLPVSFIAPPSNSTLIRPIITAGRWLAPLDKNAIVIGNQLLKLRPDLHVGDWITIKLQNNNMQWQIIGIYRLPGNTNPPLIYTNYDYLSRLMHLSGKVFSLRVLMNQHDAASQKALSNILEEDFRRRNMPVGYIQLGAVWLAQQTSQTDVLVYFMLIMAVLIASVGGLGLMGMMSINIMERTREIGVMRAIGAGGRDIQGIVVTEGLAVGLASWLAAVLFSFPITYLLDTGVGASLFQSPLPVLFSLTGSLAWLAGILLVAALSSALPAWRASRLTVRDTLAYE